MAASPRQKIVLKQAGAAARNLSSVFEMASEPAWHGPIGELRLELTGGETDLREIRAVRYVLEPEAVAAALSRSWKVELDHEVRSARLAPPGMPIEWPVELSRQSELRFAYGLPSGFRHAVRFRISARRGGAEEESLFEAVLGGETGTAEGWHEATLDLSSLGSDTVALDFATEVDDGEIDLRAGFPVWGHPELLAPTAEPTPPNVILVSIDTLRADHLSLYGYQHATSPHLDTWAASSAVVFESAVAPAPWTLPSHVSMFTGLSALRHGVNYNSTPRNLTMVAELFRRAGYTTAAVTGGAFLHPKFGLSQGFDVFRYSPDAFNENELEEGVDLVLEWLRTRGSSPFFLLLHTYAVHGPYRPRQPYAEALGGLPEDWAGDTVGISPGERSPDHGFQTKKWFVRSRSGSGREPLDTADLPTVERLYDAGIAYSDNQLSRLWRALAETGLDRTTAVIVTSDHGEALGEKGLAMHGNLYDFTLMVPLIVALPEGRHAGRRIAEQVSLVDLVPTALELADLPVPGGLDGVSLMPLIAGEAPPGRREAWSYAGSSTYGIAVRLSNRLKFIFNDAAWPPIAGREELYRLPADPDEERDLAADSPEAQHLRQRVRELLLQHHRGLTLEFDNAGETTFRGTFRGPLADQSKVKSPDIACACVSWKSRNEALLTVPPGEKFTLLLKEVRSKKIGLTGAVEGGKKLAAGIDLKTLQEPWQRAWDGSKWRQDGQGTMRIAVRWQGGLEAREPEPEATPDAELMEQLRALGYIP